MKTRQKIWIFVVLIPIAFTVWWPVWHMLSGALTGALEIKNTIAPALSDAAATESFAVWHALPNSPTLKPLVELLFDTPEFFVMFWNTVRMVLPQLIGQLAVGADFPVWAKIS